MRDRLRALINVFIDSEEYKESDIVDYLTENGVTVVKHGEWQECFEDWRKQIAGDECSVCGFQHYGTSINHYNYCPNCGAKMDGKEIDHE